MATSLVRPCFSAVVCLYRSSSHCWYASSLLICLERFHTHQSSTSSIISTLCRTAQAYLHVRLEINTYSSAKNEYTALTKYWQAYLNVRLQMKYAIFLPTYPQLCLEPKPHSSDSCTALIRSSFKTQHTKQARKRSVPTPVAARTRVYSVAARTATYACVFAHKWQPQKHVRQQKQHHRTTNSLACNQQKNIQEKGNAGLRND